MMGIWVPSDIGKQERDGRNSGKREVVGERELEDW